MNLEIILIFIKRKLIYENLLLLLITSKKESSMKKQKIKKELSFKKTIVKDLGSILGGNEPATQPVNTYKCGTINCDGGGNDPSPNPSTCDCGGPIRDTNSQCDTQHGASCVLNTVLGGGC